MYHKNLCGIVGKSKAPKYLSTLIEYCPDPTVLNEFGEVAVVPVINAFNSTDNTIKQISYITVLGEMLRHKDNGYVAKAEVRNKIKKLLITVSSSDNINIRQVVVRVLGNSGDKDVIPLMIKISKQDSYSIKQLNQQNKTIKEAYPVREEAIKALGKLKQVK